MNRALQGACALSALGIAYAAQAGDSNGSALSSARIQLVGIVPGACQILTSGAYAPNWIPGNTTYDLTPTATGIRIHFPDFAKTDGTGKELSGTYVLNVSANKPCNYVLTSENGAMKNEETDQVFRAYSADVHLQSQSGKLVHLDSLTANKTVSEFTVATAQPNPTAVNVDVKIPKTDKPLDTGHYRDRLTLTITPE